MRANHIIFLHYPVKLTLSTVLAFSRQPLAPALHLQLGSSGTCLSSPEHLILLWLEAITTEPQPSRYSQFMIPQLNNVWT